MFSITTLDDDHCHHVRVRNTDSKARDGPVGRGRFARRNTFQRVPNVGITYDIRSGASPPTESRMDDFTTQNNFGSVHLPPYKKHAYGRLAKAVAQDRVWSRFISRRIHAVDACWPVVHLVVCRCFFLSVPQNLPTCLRKHVFACTHNSSAAHSEI